MVIGAFSKNKPEKVEFLDGALQRMCGIGIDEPPCQLVYEDFFPGCETRWTTWVDQLDFVTKGKAEITYYQPPAWEEKKYRPGRSPVLISDPTRHTHCLEDFGR